MVRTENVRPRLPLAWSGHETLAAAPRRSGLQGPVLKLTSTLVIEWRYRVLERLGILCEDRVPKPDQLALAEAEANEWLATEMAYDEVERELPIYSATSTRNFQPA